jgi:hypothetical protein
MPAKRDAKKKLPAHVAQTQIGGLYPAPGGGQLRRGNPGNKGGGRRPNVVREEIRTLLDEDGLKELKRRFSSRNIKKIPHQDLVRYLDVLGKYGLGAKQEISGPDDGPLSHGVLLIPGGPGVQPIEELIAEEELTEGGDEETSS